MRDDLLDAQTAVDWAIAQIDVLRDRLNAWRRTRPYVSVIEPDSKPGYDLHRVKVVNPLPLVISAEAGAIIHMMRSSLDLLAVTLAERNGQIGPKDVYFPVGHDLAGFEDDRTLKKIKRLSNADQITIKLLKPYSGGDERIYSLHKLDLVRKHRRLIEIKMVPRSATLVRSGVYPAAENVYGGNLVDGAPLWRIASGSDADTKISIAETFRETTFGQGRPVLETLRSFGDRASEIIGLFDRP